jgi:hypothetical protein
MRQCVTILGHLKFNVEPLSFEGQQSALLKLMQTSSTPGTVTSEFGIDCSSASGKRIKSGRAFSTGFCHKNGTLEITIEVNEAELCMPLGSRSPTPILQFRLCGFRSFGPGLQATTRLGKVYARGMTGVSGPYEITGNLSVQAGEGPTSQDWREEANNLLMHLRMALSFANGGHLCTPIVEFWENDRLTVTFYRAGSSGTAELPVQPFLHLQQFFKSVAESYDSARSHRDALANAIGWLHVETTHDEVRFLSGMTALEYLASHQLPEASRQLLPEKSFQELRTEIETLLDGNTRITDEIKQAMKARLIGMNRRSLVQNIRALFELWNVSNVDIPNKALRRLVDTRNDIVHRGMTTDSDTLWELIVIVREITARFILALLKIEGN